MLCIHYNLSNAVVWYLFLCNLCIKKKLYLFITTVTNLTFLSFVLSLSSVLPLNIQGASGLDGKPGARVSPSCSYVLLHSHIYIYGYRLITLYIDNIKLQYNCQSQFKKVHLSLCSLTLIQPL